LLVESFDLRPSNQYISVRMIVSVRTEDGGRMFFRNIRMPPKLHSIATQNSEDLGLNVVLFRWYELIEVRPTVIGSCDTLLVTFKWVYSWVLESLPIILLLCC
jgi:hypothetical protein